MTPVLRFSLRPYDGPEDKRPSRLLLLDHGRPAGIWISGCALRYQFEVPGGYLLISDDDCPLEEVQHFTLISRDHRVLSRRFLGWMYCSFLIDRLSWTDERHLRLTFYKNDHWQLTIRPWGVRYFYPRLSLKRLKCP